jgi:hypothetical protein|tara:strand:- start:13718 stop:14941 length:1224 start_codon:yes stop_codon:yes gene_type:complete
MFGGICFALIYSFYYDYTGDTFVYYQDIQTLTDTFYSDPFVVLKILLNDAAIFDPDTHYITETLSFYRSNSAFYVVKIATPLNILAFNTYVGTTVLISYLSFLGVWKLFELFIKYYPSLEKKLVIATLFIPSVIFWGSGILKDSIVIGCMGYLLFAIDSLIIERKRIFRTFTLGLFCIVIILNIKAYVLFSLLPATAIWVFPTIKASIKNKAIKVFITPVIGALTIATMVGLIIYLSDASKRFSTDNVMETAKTYQNWHYLDGKTWVAGRGSSYSLGEYDETFSGVLLKVPSAIVVTLFRPYPWEVHNAVILLASIESLGVLLLTLIVFFGLGFFKVIKVLFDNPFILMCFVFSLFFAFAVGFTSYNFGALVRYKIPCLPMFIGMLFMLEYEVRKYKIAESFKYKFV